MSDKFITLSRETVQKKTELGLSTTFYSIYALLDVYEIKLNNTGNISMGIIFDMLGYKTKERREPYRKICEILEQMVDYKMIELINVDINDLKTIPFNSIIQYRKTKYFYDEKQFFKIPCKHFHYLFEVDELETKKENILMVYMYLASCIHVKRSNKDIDDESLEYGGTWATIGSLSKKTGLSQNIVKKCINYLTQNFDDHKAIFKIRNDVFGHGNYEVVQKLPTVFAYNTANANDVLNKVSKQLLEYHKEHFKLDK